jgi:hypothetical protein
MKAIQKLLSLICVIGSVFAASGQTTISGRAVGATASPLSGVQVTLIKQHILDTTQADGLFSLQIPSSVLFRENQARIPAISIRNNRIDMQLSQPQDIAICIFDMNGRKVTTILDRNLAAGKYSFTANDRISGIAAGLYIMGFSVGSAFSSVKVLIANGTMNVAINDGFSPGAAVLLKQAASFAAADTLSLIKTGYVTRKVAIQTLTTQNVGDVIIQAVSATDPIAVHNTTQDQYDQIIIQSVASHGLDSSIAMIIKAMIVIESGFNAQAISHYDTQLPCGSHSYGLLQVTPACETGFATLPSGTAVTATISGGLNGNPAVLTYANQADKTNGNTIVKEGNIVIDLVSNSSNPLWSTSAFNPAYEIDFGVKAIASVMSEMKSRFTNCTKANYVSMSLAGYNQGSGTVTGCTTYSANGQAYVNNVLSQYRTFCSQAGITPVY